jgi:hypothetical protein
MGECGGEIGGGTVADEIGDFLDGHGGIDQKLFCLIHFQTSDHFSRPLLVQCETQTGKVRSADACFLAKVRDAPWLPNPACHAFPKGENPASVVSDIQSFGDAESPFQIE